MGNVLNLKSVKMITALALMILLVAALIPAPVQAAEAKWYKGTPGYSADSKVKIGDGYFWYDYEYGEDSSKTILCYSAKKSGKTVKLSSMDYNYSFGKTIMFNGSKIYYTTENYLCGGDPVKVRIHSVSKTGKNKKILKTITVKDDCPYGELLNVYSGRLYFARYNKDWEENIADSKLYSMNMSGDSYKVTRHSSDFPFAGSAGNSRYIYAKPSNGEYFGRSATLKVFDCKEKKVVRTIKNVYKYVCSGGKLYYAATSEDGSIKGIYRASASGKDKKQILKINDQYGYGNLLKDSVYYYEIGAGRYFKYNLAKGTTEEIDESTFMTCLGPMGM